MTWNGRKPSWISKCSCFPSLSSLFHETGVTSPRIERRRVFAFTGILMVSLFVFSGWSVMNLQTRGSWVPGSPTPLVELTQCVQGVLHLIQLIVALVFMLFPREFLQTSVALELLLNSWCLTFYVGLILTHIFQLASTARGSYNVSIAVVSGIVVLFSKRWIVVYFWFLATIVSTIGTLLWEIMDPQIVIDSLVIYIERLERGHAPTTLGLFFAVFLPPFVSFSAFLYIARMREKEQSMVTHTAVAISKLSFSSPLVQRLVGKDQEDCSQTELVLKESIENMQQYSRFLPAHFRVTSGDALRELSKPDENENDTDEVTSLTDTYTQTSTHDDLTSDVSSSTHSQTDTTTNGSASLHHQRRRKRRRRRRRGSHHLTHRRSRHLASVRKNAAAFTSGFQRCFATILICCVRNLDVRLLQKQTGVHHPVVSNLNAICDELMRICRSHRGNLDSIHGSKIVISFNTVIPCVTHSRNALLCGWSFLQRLESKEFNQPYPTSSLDCLISISSGEIAFGPIGGTSFQRLVTVGRPFEIASMMQNLLVVSPEKVKGSFLYVDEAVRNDVRYEFEIRIVSSIQVFEQSQFDDVEVFEDDVDVENENEGIRIRVYRCCGSRLEVGGAAAGSSTPVEWLYEIGSQCDAESSSSDDDSNGEDNHQRSIDRRVNRQWSELWSKMEEGEGNGEEDDEGGDLDRWKESLEEMARCYVAKNKKTKVVGGVVDDDSEDGGGGGGGGMKNDVLQLLSSLRSSKGFVRDFVRM